MATMNEKTENRAMSDKFMLRMPDGMRDELKRLAAESGRSLNAEIIYRLQRTLSEDDTSEYETKHIKLPSIRASVSDYDKTIRVKLDSFLDAFRNALLREVEDDGKTETTDKNERD